MFLWIADNIGTIIICAVLIGVVAAIIISIIIKRERDSQQAAGVVVKIAPMQTPAIKNKRFSLQSKRPSPKLFKPLKWCKIGASHYRFYYKQQKNRSPKEQNLPYVLYI